MLFMGNILYNEGSFGSFCYYCDAVEAGSVQAAYILNENLTMKEENPIAKRMIQTIEEQIEFLVEKSEWKIKDGQDEYGEPQFALALVGLYDLGVKQGIDRRQGEKYLEEAIKKKNSNAQYMKENPLLMKPETMKQFKVPTAEEMQKAEKEMVKEWEKRKKESKPITGLILTLIGTIIRVLPAIIMEDTFGSGFPHVLIIVVGIIFTILGLRSTLRCSAGVFGKILLFVIHGVIAILGVHIILALVPVFSIVFLLWAAMLYSESGGGGFFSSGSDSDPMKKYNENHNCDNMPSCIYDSSGNRWDKQRSYGSGAVYSNYDLGETTITYCDIDSKSASGSRGWFKWY